MVSMTKEEIATYLDDFTIIMEYLMHEPNLTIEEAFNRCLYKKEFLNCTPEEYLIRMKRVYLNYLYMKYFSIIEDFLLNRDDFVLNDDLSEIDINAAKKIDGYKGFSNKQLIQLIRNAFNHNNDTEFERFKMSKNAKNMEISFQDLRTDAEKKSGVEEKPLNLKFDLSFLSDIYEKLEGARRNELYISYAIPEDFNPYSSTLEKDLDNVKVIRFYINKKLKDEQIEELAKYNAKLGDTREELLEKSRKKQEYLVNITEPHYFTLSKGTKENIISHLEYYKSNNPFVLADLPYNYMSHILNNCIPIPGYKSILLSSQLAVIDSFFSHYDMTVNRMINVIENVTKGLGVSSYELESEQSLYDRMKENRNSNNREIRLNLIDGETEVLPSIMFIDFVITHMCSDEEIIIGKEVYDKEKIRNSLAHVRWVFNHSTESIIFYDADPRNINDLNLERVAEIRLATLYTWAKNYLEMGNEEKIEFVYLDESVKMGHP